MTTEEDRSAVAGRRAGSNMWRWDGLSIWIVENTIDLGDLQPILEEVQPEFGVVDVRRRVAGPMAGGLFPEAALVLAAAIAAHGFLSELGKDVYAGFRSALYAAYQKARTWANDRGYRPLSIQLAREEGATLVFIFPAGLDYDVFEAALQALLRLYGEVDVGENPGEQPWYVVFEFEIDSAAWRRMDWC